MEQKIPGDRGSERGFAVAAFRQCAWPAKEVDANGESKKLTFVLTSGNPVEGNINLT